jgi:hypothetical protein
MEYNKAKRLTEIMCLQNFLHAKPILSFIMHSLHDVNEPIGPKWVAICLRQTTHISTGEELVGF